MGNVIADFVMDETLNYILLMSADDDAAHVGVIRFGKEIPSVRWMSPVFQGNKVVLLIAGHVIGMHYAPGGIDLPRIGIYEFRPGLVDGVPVSPKLFPL